MTVCETQEGTLIETTLAESLKNDAGWEIFHFGYNGPNAPYVRIGMIIDLANLRIRPSFESFIKDKILFRTKVDLEKHLRRYSHIMVKPMAFEENFGREFATPDSFPFSRWLRIGRRVNYCDFVVMDDDHSPLSVLPMHTLSMASDIYVRRSSIR